MEQATKDIIKLLGNIDRSKSRTDVFRDFCELAYCATAKAASPFEEQCEKLEAQYVEIVARYRNKDDIRAMPKILAIALQTMTTGGCDLMGEIAGELGALNADMGKFFTPYEVSRLMAEINLTGAKETIEQEGFITVSEPAAGAGGMLVAVADMIEGLGFDPAQHIWVEAVELNRTTFHMGYLQISARGLAGRVTHGNSLSMETFSSAYTAAAPHFFAINGHPFAKQRAAQVQADAERAALEAERAKTRAGRMQNLIEGDAIKGEQIDLFK
jgi:type I restriction-modification system DNA methylase subunit